MITGLCSVGHLPGHCLGRVWEESLDVGGWEIDGVGGGSVVVHLNDPYGETFGLLQSRNGEVDRLCGRGVLGPRAGVGSRPMLPG